MRRLVNRRHPENALPGGTGRRTVRPNLLQKLLDSAARRRLGPDGLREKTPSPLDTRRAFYETADSDGCEAR